jgi:succinate-acetate transporter protein
MAETASGKTPARVFLQPVAAPSILGLYGFAGSTFIVAANLAHWYGTPDTPLFLFEFATFFGGVAQFAAGMWAYKARDGLATAMHGMWGAFWMGWGLLNLLLATGTLKVTDPNFLAGFGYWFIALGAITFMGAIAAMAENLGLAAVLHTLWIGSGLLAIGFLVSGNINSVWVIIGGWVLLLSALCAWYAASALMFEGIFGRPVLPMGATEKATREPDINTAEGEPGVMKGQ